MSLVLQNYLKIDGIWYRGLCEDCLTLVQRLDQQFCYHCVVRVKPENCVHDMPHSEETKRLVAEKKTKSVLSYMGLHTWLRREYGAANKCENKICEGRSQKFNWACIGEYAKDIKNFVQLCVSCHVSLDKYGKEIVL